MLASSQESGDSESEHDVGSSIKLVPTAPVVLFGRDAPPLSKVLLQSQPERSKSFYKALAKRKIAPAAAAPRAKARKTTTRRDRRVASPIPSDSETPSDNQVRVLFAFSFQIAQPVTSYSVLLLQDNAENTPGQEQPRNLEISPAIPEHKRQEEPALETVETANTLAGLQHSEAPIAVSASTSSQAKVHPSIPNRLRILASGCMLILVFLSGFRLLSDAVF